MWHLLTAIVCFTLGWFGKGYFGSFSAVEQAIVSEYRRFGTVSVISSGTGATVQAVPKAHDLHHEV